MAGHRQVSRSAGNRSAWFCDRGRCAELGYEWLLGVAQQIGIWGLRQRRQTRRRTAMP